MDVSGINKYSSMIDSSNYSKYENKINPAKEDATDEELMNACKAFEQYMVEQVYKAAEGTIMKAEEESDYEQYFGDMRIEQYAKSVTDQGKIGLAQKLYDSMKKNV